MSDETDPKRRTFLAVAAVGGCAIGAAALVPGAGVVAAPLSEPPEKGLRFVVGKVDDFEKGVPKKIAIVGDEVDAWNRAPKRKLGAVWIERTGDKELRAFSVVCPHLGCSVDVVTDDTGKAKAYNCPCHDSNFGLDGSRGEGPSPRGLDPLPVEIAADGSVAVTYKRFRLGVETREEA